MLGSMQASAVPDTIADYERRYPAFMREMRADIEELLATGRMSRAVELSRSTGQHLNHATFPMFFTGDLDADFVLVHLNPKQDVERSDRLEPPLPYDSFEDYFDGHHRFGRRHYGPAAPGRHYSRFDGKQVVFARPFRVIDFVDESTPRGKLENLERVVDRKLQMELVPYGSPDFRTSAFAAPRVRDHFDRVLRVVCGRPRRYVFFCGNAFRPLLQPYAIDQHEFQLTRKDGLPEAMRSRYANLRIPFDGETVAAGLCHSWPRQGLPMAAYAEAVLERYQA
jgi:hypothetical protein